MIPAYGLAHYKTMSGFWESAFAKYRATEHDAYLASCCACADALDLFLSCVFLELHRWARINGWEVMLQAVER